jgi:uncharacterized SAM-binding protein YcdF (DUF218 family)
MLLIKRLCNMKRAQSFLKRLASLFHKFVFGMGLVALVFVVLSFTDYPYYAYHWLGTANAKIEQQPDYIIVMGAGGMPSAKGVLRCYYAAKAAEMFPEARLIVTLPADSAGFAQSAHQLMIDDLRERGVDSSRIWSEYKGTNTYTQAREIRQLITETSPSLLLITSPDHMYRSVLTFRKQGFENTGGMATFEHALEQELLIEKDKKGKVKDKSSQMLGLRYNFWGYLNYQIIVLREYLAIGYYKLRGYI